MITDTLLRSLLPNTFAYGIGDIPLIDRIRPHIPQAEYFLYSELCPAKILLPHIDTADTAGTAAQDTVICTLVDRVTAAHALWSAIPALDITLSPTGFAVGSTDALQPASASRVKELRATILSIRDQSILQLLPILPAVPGWLHTPQAELHTASLLSPVQISELREPGQPFSWAAYRRTLTLAASAQSTLAGSYLSIPLTEQLRAVAVIDATYPRPAITAALSDDPAEPDPPMEPETPAGPEVPDNTVRDFIHSLLPGATSESYLALRTLLAPARRWLQARIAESIGSDTAAPQPHAHASDTEILDTVSWIRDHPELYPAWHSSATALRYAHKPFRNSRSSGGYFF